MIDAKAVARAVVDYYRSMPSDFDVTISGSTVMIQCVDFVRYEFTMEQMEEHIVLIGGKNESRARSLVEEIALDMQEAVSNAEQGNMPLVLYPGEGFVPTW